MHKPANPARVHMETIRAIGLEFSLWLLALIAHVATLAGSRTLRLWVQDETAYARRVLRQHIFLLAFAQCDVPCAQAHRPRRPPNRRRGFRYQRRRRGLVKHVLRGVDLATLKAIRRAYDDADALAARVARRIRPLATGGGWIAVRPPARLMTSAAPPPRAAAADTS